MAEGETDGHGEMVPQHDVWLMFDMENITNSGYNLPVGGMDVAQIDVRGRLLADMQSDSNEAVVAASFELFARGEYGSPAGIHLLKGGQAAFGMGRLIDSAVLLLEGLEVAEPHTQVWAELLASRSVTCARVGYDLDAISTGTRFLENADAFPELAKWVPHVHHAIGYAHDRMRQHSKAVPHHREALEHYSDPIRKALVMTDLAYSLARSGETTGADYVLAQVPVLEDARVPFFVRGTTAIVRYIQGRFAEAVADAEQAVQLAQGQEEALAVPLLEVRYWLARAYWAVGNGVYAAREGLHVAVAAQTRWQPALSEDATDLLREIRDKGGLSNA